MDQGVCRRELIADGGKGEHPGVAAGATPGGGRSKGADRTSGKGRSKKAWMWTNKSVGGCTPPFQLLKSGCWFLTKPSGILALQSSFTGKQDPARLGPSVSSNAKLSMERAFVKVPGRNGAVRPFAQSLAPIPSRRRS
jgi:hypothetical protein